jgi:hypothetical protein
MEGSNIKLTPFYSSKKIDVMSKKNYLGGVNRQHSSSDSR